MKKQFAPKDIRRIKNVTDIHTGQAYMNLSVDDKFVLLFPTSQKGNVSSPEVGELILLRQTVNGISAFTHLVSPVDNETVDENIHSDFRYGRNVQVVAITPVNNLIAASTTKWNGVFSRGNACKIKKPDSFGKFEDFQNDVWERFNPFFSRTKHKTA